MCEPDCSSTSAAASSSYDQDEITHLPKTARSTFISLGSEDTVSSAGDLTSTRSSYSSSGYSGSRIYSICDCHYEDLPVLASTPLPVHGHNRHFRCSKLCYENDANGAINYGDKEASFDCQSGFQPSLKMIRKLKRLSDAWSKVFRTPDELIIDRLKKGREEAIKKQTYIEDLLNEASSQYSIQHQAKAVIQLCPDETNLDEIEAERIILLAGERCKAYHEEAERIVTDLGPSISETPVQLPENDEHQCPATLYISDIKLRLSQDFSTRLETSPRDHTHYFLCLLKEKRTKGIIATQIVSAQGHSSSPLLHFNDRLTLPEIPPNFDLLIEIYHMSNKGKVRSRKKILSRVLSSVKRVPNIRYLSCTSGVTDDSCYRTVPSLDPIQSSFVYAGSASIERKNLLLHGGHEISDSKIASMVELEVNADPVYEDSSMEGYLNICDKEWERRWFTLNDTSLTCWRYPEHPQQQQEGPLCQWDISKCHKSIYSPSEDSYTLKHVFILPLEDSKELVFSAYTCEQENNWKTALNSIIHCNLEWVANS